mmetsp:Transcript_59808/g.177263  ORF Transcript_59808/g.177263 Transcript_59808/m.177263 type:complete len:361 (+) Transcript_59808:367-1449(+)
MHRPSPPRGKAVPVQINNVDVVGMRGDALLQYLEPLVDQRVQQPPHDLVRGELRSAGGSVGVGGYELRHFGGGEGTASLPYLGAVVVPSLHGLLTHPAQLGHHLVGEGGVPHPLGPVLPPRPRLDVVDQPLLPPNVVPDIIPREVAHGERSHGHSEIGQRPVHLAHVRRASVLQHEYHLGRVGEQHSVADESVAIPHRRADLPHPFGHAPNNVEGGGGGVFRSDDLHQFHNVGGTEEVHTGAEGASGRAQRFGDQIDVEGGGVAQQQGVRTGDGVERGEDGLLHVHILEDGLHDQGAPRQIVEGGGAPQAGHPLPRLGLGRPPPLRVRGEYLSNRAQSAFQPRVRGVDQGDGAISRPEEG